MPRKGLTKEQFIEKANKQHNNKYDYSNLVIGNVKTKVKIICPFHGEFEQNIHNHLKGSGCSKCNGGVDSKGNEKFILDSKKVHGDKYDYSLVDYKNYKTNVTVICKEHGEFSQRPGHHTAGSGCPSCKVEKIRKINKKTQDVFVEESSLIHKNKYDYSKTVYKGIKNKVFIICPEHGEFEQLADSHNKGKGCPRCSYSISKAEDEIVDLLSDNLFVEKRFKTNDGKEVDVFIPSLNIGIEYNGLRWHSEEFGRGEKYHLDKTLQSEKQGIQLIHIFEDEWLYKKEIVKSRLLNLVGKIPNKIYARRCEIKEVSSGDSMKFLEQNHIQGSVGSQIKIGLYYNDELVSLMNFSKPRINIGGKKEEGTYELIRFSNKLNTTVVGGASKLLKYFERNYNPKEIISYADRRWSQGNLYTQLGFDFIHFSQPNYFYVKSKRRENRFGYRKSILVKQGFDKNKTEKEIMQERGFNRIYDCGTLKFMKTYE